MRKGSSQQRTRVTTRARTRRASNVHETGSPGSPVRWSSSPAVAKKRSAAVLATPGSKSPAKDQGSPLDRKARRRTASGGKRPRASVSDKEAGLAGGKSDRKWAVGLTKSRSSSLGKGDDADGSKKMSSNGLVCVVKIDQCDTDRQRSSIARTPDKAPERSKPVSPKSASVKRISLAKTPGGLPLATDAPKSLQKYGTPIMKQRKLMSGDSGGKSKRLSLDAKHMRRRFSKSPKIVLRSPKPKPKSKRKGKSPTLNVSRKSFFSMDMGKRRGKDSSSPNKSIIRDGKVKTPSAAKDPDPSRQSLSIRRRYKEILRRKPIVLLHRLSPVAKKDKGESPRVERPGRKRSGVDVSLKPSEPPLMSSTPQDEKKRPRERPREAKSPSRPGRPNRSGLGGHAAATRSPVVVPEIKMNGGSIEDESEPSFRDLEPSLETVSNQQQQQTSSRRNSNRLKKELLSVAGEPRKQEDVNATYELLEPQTPQLRKEHRKRSLLEANSREQNRTKTGRTTRSGSPKQRSSLTRPEPPPAKRMKPHVETPRPPPGISVEAKSGTGGKNALVKPRKRSVSAPIATPSKTPARMQPRPGPFSTGKPGLTIGHDLPSAASESKYSATKKPNFSEIHKKLFSKAESITDAKRRLEDRHRALTQCHASVPQANKPTGIQRVPPSVGYNRFGFKLRKDEAVNRIMGKRDPLIKEKQRKETRQLVKGVRMNRRFELQMRARKLNG